jgi:hypothetical protein
MQRLLRLIRTWMRPPAELDLHYKMEGQYDHHVEVEVRGGEVRVLGGTYCSHMGRWRPLRTSERRRLRAALDDLERGPLYAAPPPAADAFSRSLVVRRGGEQQTYRWWGPDVPRGYPGVHRLAHELAILQP